VKVPVLKIDGKLYKPKKRMKLLRKFFRLRESDIDIESEEGLDQLYDFIVSCYNDPAVTPESIDENVDIDEFFILFRDLGQWLMYEMQKKFGELPNEKTAERN
jgi:hypothetical protein